MTKSLTPAIFTLRGKAIREDRYGHLCLDDIWEIAGAKPSREPRRWRILPTTRRIIEQLEQNVRTSALKARTDVIPVIYAKRGRGNSGTFAHPILAAGYAGYLSPKLEIEIREVWLRYRAGDATLADEVLERASAEDNLWVAARAQGRAKRIEYTDVLRAHGVREYGYAKCTNAVYQQIIGQTAAEFRSSRNLKGGANVRDHLNLPQLTYISAAESLAADRIEELNCQGNDACERASARSAGFIREAIERDKADRKKPAA